MSTDYYSTSLTPFLREPPAGSARRSAYEVEANPWARRGDVEAALFYRGTIVSAFGYIETRMGELAIRASRLDVYSAMRENFPFSAEKRSTYLRKVFSTGPLKSFGAIAGLALDRFDAAAELRHLVAHARMQVLPDWGVSFDDFPKSGRGGLTVRRRRFLLEDLEREAWRAARLSRLCQHLLSRLNAFDILPEIE